MAETRSEALRDALVLLRAFTSSPWRSLETANGAMRLSISKMTSAERASPPMSSRSTAGTLEKPGRRLTAPHVANLLEVASPGETIHAGEKYAKIQVLDEIIDLHAEENLLVISRDVKPGDLVEFGSPLIVVQ